MPSDDSFNNQKTLSITTQETLCTSCKLCHTISTHTLDHRPSVFISLTTAIAQSTLSVSLSQPTCGSATRAGTPLVSYSKSSKRARASDGVETNRFCIVVIDFELFSFSVSSTEDTLRSCVPNGFKMECEVFAKTWMEEWWWWESCCVGRCGDGVGGAAG